MPRTILRQYRISRRDLKANPSVYYIFGDNLAQVGMKGQSWDMRGEPNAIGVPTKEAPYSYMHDVAYDSNCRAIDRALAKIPKDCILVLPLDGVGTGNAQLDKMAPRTYAYLVEALKKL